MMATNYIGAFYLTNLLLPLPMSSRIPVRVVNVTSFSHRTVTDMQVDKEFVAGMPSSKSPSYPFARIYEYSKLCLLLFTYELHQKFSSKVESSHVSIVAADPGVVKTNIMRHMPSCTSQLAFIVLKLLGLLQSPEDGVASILDAALAPPDSEIARVSQDKRLELLLPFPVAYTSGYLISFAFRPNPLQLELQLPQFLLWARWSIIAAQLPGRTDNDIKNYWNTKLKKLMGVSTSIVMNHNIPQIRIKPNTGYQQSPLLHSPAVSSTSPYTTIVSNYQNTLSFTGFD